MHVRLLGQIEAASDDGRSITIHPSKARWLLALLALRSGRRCSTEEIIDGLWGQNPPSSSTNLVQGYISDLRKLIGSSRIHTVPGGYLLDIDETHIDVTEFRRLIAEAFACPVTDAAQITEFVGDALALWSGIPFGERPPQGALAVTAAGLEELRLEAIELRVEAELDQGRHLGLVTEIEELLGDQPYREKLWNALALSLYRGDRQTEALRRLQDARRMLAEELGIDPSPALVELERRILDHDSDLHASAASTTTTSHLVGRVSELARLNERLLQVRSGAQKLLFIGGEPGIGKTTIAGSLATSAAEEDSVVLLGRCDDHLAIPYRPFVEAITEHLRALDSREVERLITPRAALAIAVVPSIKPLLSTALAAASPVELTLLDRFETFRWLLQQIGGNRSTVLVLDDVHWADSASLRLIHYLISGSRLPGFLTLATYRTTEPAELLTDILADLRSDPQTERMNLGGLSVPELSALVGQEADAGDLALWIHGETAGNPFLAREVIAHVAATGSRDGLPAGVGEVVQRRLRRLSADAHYLLQRAAVLGDSAPISLLRLVAPDLENVSASLSELTSRGILTEEQASERRYRFTHAIIRSAVTASMTSLEREDRHLEAAEAWAGLPKTADSALAMASHYQAAGSAAPSDTAATAFAKAGDHADQSGAKVEAVQWYDRALALLPDDDPRRRSVRLTRFVAAQAAWHWHHGDHKRAQSPDA